MNNFWNKLEKPIYALAPMAGVTDSAFRQICKSFGASVAYSEMASAAGLVYNPKKTLELLKYSKREKPYVVQLFGANPAHFAEAVKIVEKRIKPDGIDLNFGCPVKKVARQGAGAVLMDNIKLARLIIMAAIKNANLPVSIKIRARAGKTDALMFLRAMADLHIKAVMIHGRTLAQGHSGPVDWKIIKQARPLVKGVLLANGGVGLTACPSLSLASASPAVNPEPAKSPCLEREAKAYADWLIRTTGADGVGIAQGALGKPWIFEEVKGRNHKVKNKKEIFEVMLKHVKLAEKLKGKQGIIEMRKYLCWYVSGLPNAGALRQKLIKAENIADIKNILL